MLLDTRCRTLATRTVLRSWSELDCALAWTVLATLSLRTSSRLRHEDQRSAPPGHAALVFRSVGEDFLLQQDAAPCHTARTTRALLGEMFRAILTWPALSPDFTRNDCAFWGCTGVCWRTSSADATTLRAAIIKIHAKITGDQIKRTIWHFTRRFRLCLAADGFHFAASLRLAVSVRRTLEDGSCTTRFKVHLLCHLVLFQHIATDATSHSVADSRDKLHLTRHHPIHAQRFTIRSLSQVPCCCLASTCSGVSIRPPCF